MFLFFVIFLFSVFPSPFSIGWHVVTLVIYSPLLTGLEVLVPTVWDQVLIPIHLNETGTLFILNRMILILLNLSLISFTEIKGHSYNIPLWCPFNTTILGSHSLLCTHTQTHCFI